ncbi:MAG: FAD-dependent oxidoreductase [Actinobacteria bacterium]|nr:MAG: FAD-dependent oxidoreductase [Actinomycetota bacterium]
MDRTDVLIVGAGPAGLSAAAETTRHGIDTVLVDSRPLAGGQFYARGAATIDGLPEQLLEGLDQGHLELRLGTDVWGVFPDEVVSLTREERSELIAYRVLVIATGAMERPQPFPGWELPGVMAAGAAQLLVKDSAAIPRGRVVVAGTGPFLLPVAAELLAAGADVGALVEAAPRRRLARLLPALIADQARGREAISYLRALRAVDKRFGARIQAAKPGVLVLSNGEELGWDVLCVGHGFVPRLQLARLAGLDVDEGRIGVASDLRTSRAGIYAAGEVTGVGGASLAAVEGRIAGLAIARDFGGWRRSSSTQFRRALARRRRLQAFARMLSSTYSAFGALELATPETVLCRCEGVTLAQVQAAAGFWMPGEGARAAKALLRCGMGPCQGELCLETVSAAVGGGHAARWSQPRVRPPIAPVSVAELAALAHERAPAGTEPAQ